MLSPRQHFYQSQRLKLSYWEWGDRSNPPLVFVHGGRDHARSWDRIASQFSGDYYVIACDLRGHGDSDWALGSSYPAQDHVADLVALLNLLAAPALVVGHSFGGGIVLLTAATFPALFRGVVAIEGAGVRSHLDAPMDASSFRTWIEQQRKREGREQRVYQFEDAVARMQQSNTRLLPEVAAHLTRWGMHSQNDGYVWKFDPWVGIRSAMDPRGEDMISLWRSIECPVLHLIGASSDEDRSRFRERKLEELFSDSRTQIVNDAGHWPHHDQPEAVTDAIRSFVAGLTTND